MIELFTPEQMRTIDQKLIEELHISGIQLMENAAEGVAARVRKAYRNEEFCEIYILCGPGNNGGDGFAVASILQSENLPVYVVILFDVRKIAGDAEYEYERAIQNGCRFISEEQYLEKVNEKSIAVDAIFGTGLSRNVSDSIARVIELTEKAHPYIISVDIPSGLNGKTGAIMGKAFHADETVTFHRNKIGLYSENGRMHTGNIILHPITDRQTDDKTDAYLLERSDISEWLPERPLNSHKGKNGRALILGGCEQYKRAVKLCTAAALRGGCGLLSVAVPDSIAPAFYDMPEAMCIPLSNSGTWDAGCCENAKEYLAGKSAIAAGPGMGTVADTSLFTALLDSGTPAVIDADGLNHISKNRELINRLHKKIVLTPHPMELARLLRYELDDILNDAPGIVMRAANELNAIVVLKGATSYISDGAHLYLNTTGNPGLSKGGSGDTLTGLILAMLSQGLDPLHAACAGAYLLGASADEAVELLGTRLLLAGDVIGLVEATAKGIRLQK